MMPKKSSPGDFIDLTSEDTPTRPPRRPQKPITIDLTQEEDDDDGDDNHLASTRARNSGRPDHQQRPTRSHGPHISPTHKSNSGAFVKPPSSLILAENLRRSEERCSQSASRQHYSSNLQKSQPPLPDASSIPQRPASSLQDRSRNVHEPLFETADGGEKSPDTPKDLLAPVNEEAPRSAEGHNPKTGRNDTLPYIIENIRQNPPRPSPASSSLKDLSFMGERPTNQAVRMSGQSVPTRNWYERSTDSSHETSRTAMPAQVLSRVHDTASRISEKVEPAHKVDKNTDKSFGTNMPPPQAPASGPSGGASGPVQPKPRTHIVKSAPSQNRIAKSAPSLGLNSTRKLPGLNKIVKRPQPAHPQNAAMSAPLPARPRQKSSEGYVESQAVRECYNNKMSISEKRLQGTRQSLGPATSLAAGNVAINVPSLEDAIAKLEAHLQDLREGHAYRIENLLSRQRRFLLREAWKERQNEVSLKPKTYTQKDSPFANMPILSDTYTTGLKSGDRDQVVHIIQEIHGGRSSRSHVKAPFTPYKSEAVDVPFYHEYTSLEDNVLAENVDVLKYWPDVEQHVWDSGLYKEMSRTYHMMNDKQPRHILQAERSRIYRPVAEAFLKELRIGWESVLYWLLAKGKDVARIDPSLMESEEFIDRRQDCKEDFNRASPKWRSVFSSLPKPSVPQLWSSARACSAFRRVFGLSLWHLARRSYTEQEHLDGGSIATKEHRVSSTGFSFRQLSCRVCHLHDCPRHGEVREDPESSAEDEAGGEISPAVSSSTQGTRSYAQSSSDEHDTGDEPALSSSEPEHGPINYKKMVNLGPDKVIQHKPDDYSTTNLPWLNKNVPKTSELAERKVFFPCRHDTSCEQAKCRCYREHIACEKTCACPASCKRRFRGCRCGPGACAEDPNCECWSLNRECDADLCGPCGAGHVLDPNNRHDEDVEREYCHNVRIQHNLPKKTFLGQSEVHGFGLFAGEPIKDGDYLGEYKGEITTFVESCRRGTIYQYLKTQYLFKLGIDQEIDSTHAGNKLRFINHSKLKRIINCQPKYLLCNTVQRIGLFAVKKMKPGEELFFDYGSGYEDEAKKFWEKGEKENNQLKKGKVVVVKNKTQGPEKLKKSASGGSKEPISNERRAQLGKARDAKAAKAAARKEEGLAVATSSHLDRPQATKSAVEQCARPQASSESNTVLAESDSGSLSQSRNDTQPSAIHNDNFVVADNVEDDNDDYRPAEIEDSEAQESDDPSDGDRASYRGGGVRVSMGSSRLSGHEGLVRQRRYDTERRRTFERQQSVVPQATPRSMGPPLSLPTGLSQPDVNRKRKQPES